MHDAAKNESHVFIEFRDVPDELCEFFPFRISFYSLQFIYDYDRCVFPFAGDIADDIKGFR